MLVIRREQMEAFAAQFLKEFENERVPDFAERFPNRVASLGEQGLRRLVRDGAGAARAFGILTENDASTLIDLMLLLGDRFYDDPRFAFQSEPLRDQSLPPGARIALTVARLGLSQPLSEAASAL